MAMQHELLEEWLQSSGVEASTKAALVEILLGGASAARKKQCSYPGEAEPDLSWQLGWKQSGVLAAALFEDLLFSGVFDGRYRDGVKSKATAADVLAYESIHCRVAEVEKAIREERTPETAASAAPAAPSSSTPAETAASAGFGKIPEASKESWEKVHQEDNRGACHLRPRPENHGAP